MTKTAVVIPGRAGDIINVLPCVRDIALKEGGKCAVVVSAEFSGLLQGCFYTQPVVISSHFTDVEPAIRMAQGMFERVLVAKTNEKAIGVSTQCESFSEESWRQCGYLSEYHRLPLVFDRRDRVRERTLLALAGHEPFGLLNLGGKSSPYPYANELRVALGSSLRWIDLQEVKAQRIYDLLGLMDAAEVLITGDTATMHLAAASSVPCINLIQDQPTRWHGSKPRNNSMLELRYGESRTRLHELKDLPLKHRPRTWHVWSDYPMTGDTLARHTMARRTWEPTGWINFPVPPGRVMNDGIRSVPFVKDMVNMAVQCAGPRDTIVLTNSDTCLSPDAAQRVSDAVNRNGCCYSFRRDFDRVELVLSAAEIQRGHQYAGADLFAFTVRWWQQNAASVFPDLLLGAEMWDWCLRVLMRQYGGWEFSDLIFHQRHPNIWEQHQYRNALPSQRHNKTLAIPFLTARGETLNLT